LLGALVLETLQQEFTLRFSAGGGMYLIVYGALFLVVILLMPRGIVPTLRDALANVRAGRPGPKGMHVQTPLRSRS
jgi:branched-chain amino acid transport system permease protein